MQDYSPTPWAFNHVEDNENGLPKVWDSNGNEVCECNGDNNTEKEANARLCASAPELLKACKEALRLLVHSDLKFNCYGNEYHLLCEAIIKAEGKI